MQQQLPSRGHRNPIPFFSSLPPSHLPTVHALQAPTLDGLPPSAWLQVKSAEPVLSVALSQLILGERNPPYVWLSLLPIIAGCSLAAMKEVGGQARGSLART